MPEGRSFFCFNVSYFFYSPSGNDINEPLYHCIISFMTIYLDIIFLENLFMNFIILFATTVIMKEKAKVIRIGVSSTIGSIYVIVMNVVAFEFFSNTALAIVLSIIMVYIAFAPRNIKKLLKQLMFFYVTSFTFGGATFALIYLLDLQIVLLGALISSIIIILTYSSIKGKISRQDILCELAIGIDNKIANVKAIVDTGNFLKEPITGAPVVVVEKQELQGIIPNKILDKLIQILDGEEIGTDEYAHKIRVIPFSSLGKENGLLIGVKIDFMTIEIEGENIYVKDVIVGVYEGKLSRSGKYKALIGLELLEQKGGNYEHIGTIKA